MLMVATGSILGGAHPVGLALRLWLFAAVYLSVARVVLASVRTQARRNAGAGHAHADRRARGWSESIWPTA